MEIIERFKAPTPKFWRKVRNVCGAVVAVTGAIVLMPVLFPVVLPAAIITVASYAGAIATFGATLAQATRDDGSIDLSKLDLEELLKIRDGLAAQLRPLSGEEKAALLHVSKLIGDANGR